MTSGDLTDGSPVPPWKVREREQQALLDRLEANRARRAAAEAELQAARDELAALLAEGRGPGQMPLIEVTRMAHVAGVSRDTAHRLIRASGDLTDAPPETGFARPGAPPGHRVSDTIDEWISRETRLGRL